MAAHPRRRKLSGYAWQKQVAMMLLLALGVLFGIMALTGGIQMLLNGQEAGEFSTAKAGLPPSPATSYGPVTPIVLGSVLLAVGVVTLLAQRKTKQRRRS